MEDPTRTVRSAACDFFVWPTFDHRKMEYEASNSLRPGKRCSSQFVIIVSAGRNRREKKATGDLYHLPTMNSFLWQQQLKVRAQVPPLCSSPMATRSVRKGDFA